MKVGYCTVCGNIFDFDGTCQKYCSTKCRNKIQNTKARHKKASSHRTIEDEQHDAQEQGISYGMLMARRRINNDNT